MQPGVELDDIIATKIMGWERDVNHDYGKIYADKQGYMVMTVDEFKPSTEIEHAWMVVDKLNEMGYSIETRQYANGYASVVTWLKNPQHGAIVGDTVPNAICLAAIKEFGVEIES